MKVPFYQVLGYLGALPLVLLAAGIVHLKTRSLGDSYLSFLDSYGLLDASFVSVMCGYAVSIVCFLSGAHWFNAIRSENRLHMMLCIIPSAVTLLFMGTMHSPIGDYIFSLGLVHWVRGFALLGLGVGFVGVYFLDRIFLSQTILPDGYMKFRLILTVIVVSCFFVCSGAEVYDHYH